MSDNNGILEAGKDAEYGEPLFIVLDTNVVFKHRRLSGPLFDLLQAYLNWTGSTIIMPAIVLQEAIKNFREHVSQKTSQVETAIAKLDGLMIHPSGAQLPPMYLQKACEEYETSLRERLKVLKADVPEYSDVPITDVVTRALGPRRPFCGEDRGFRDCVIWETILRRVVNKDRPTVFITDNINDFAEAGQLHPDLKEDLRGRGLSQKAVTLVKTIDEFYQQFIVPFREKIAKDPEWASYEITAGNWPQFDLDAFLAENAQEFLSVLDSQAHVLASEAGFWNRTIRKLEEPFNVVDIEFDPNYTELIEAVPVEDGKVFIEAGAGGTARLDVMLFKGEYYGTSEDMGMEVMDGDWNKHYMWVQTPVKFRLTIHITLDLKANKVTEWEADAVEVPEPCWDSEPEVPDDE